MKKKLLIVFLPVVLMVAGAFGVWANEQNAVRPGCNNCVMMEKAAPCANCPNAANMEQGTAPCGNCAKMKGAAAAPPAGNAGCNKCAKMQPVQPMPKGCCNKSQPM